MEPPSCSCCTNCIVGGAHHCEGSPVGGFRGAPPIHLPHTRKSVASLLHNCAHAFVGGGVVVGLLSGFVFVQLLSFCTYEPLVEITLTFSAGARGMWPCAGVR